MLSSVMCASCCHQAGDLYKALKKDKEGALLWNKRCRLDAPRPDIAFVWGPMSCPVHAILFGACRAGGAGIGRAIALDIARGLTFLHSNNIAHMDLKTPNGAHPPALSMENMLVYEVGLRKLVLPSMLLLTACQMRPYSAAGSLLDGQDLRRRCGRSH